MYAPGDKHLHANTCKYMFINVIITELVISAALTGQLNSPAQAAQPNYFKLRVIVGICKYQWADI